jgi:scyllo-inosamine-4-phosphate amidinotransferase 1
VNPSSLVSVHNEWDDLEEIVVGIVDHARMPRVDVSLQAVEYPESRSASEIPSGPFSPRVLEETAEDLEALVAALQRLGVRVRRPQPEDHSRTFSTPDWETDGFHNYCPRDVLLAIGQTVIEAPMALRSRFLEAFSYKPLLIEYLKSGSRWLAAPRPRLLDSMYDLTDSADGSGRPARGKRVLLQNHEPVFDAANVLRLGRDLLYLVSSSGNELGCQWLQSTLGSEYRVHPCRDLYVHTHIDSTITVIRPGLVVLNPERVNDRNLPAIFERWDKIWSPPMVDIGWEGRLPYSTIWIGMNFLMVTPRLAIIERRQEALIREVEKHGVEVLPLELRHARTLGGGFHCVTLDVRRRGTLEDYSR